MEMLYAILLGYLLGSVPFGLLLARAAGKGDVRDIGSGNIGATNVLRAGSKGLAAATLALDLAKGYTPVFIAQYLWGGPAVAFAAGAAVIGHCFPIWLKFKGGKGVATYAGVAFGMAWQVGLVFAGVWLSIIAIFRISSLAGLSAVVAASAAAPLLGHPEYFPVMAAIAGLIIYLHRENITRLIKDEEPPIGGRN